MAKKNNTASNNPYSGPVRYQYNPINYAAYAEPLLNHQQQYDKTMSALDETNYDIAHMTQDKELTDKMEKGLQGDLDKVSKDLLANADYRGAARKLSKLNKFYNNDDHMNAVRSSYTSEQAFMKELNEGDYTADYKQKRLATERGNFKGTSFDEGSYNIFNPGVNYKDYTDEIKKEIDTLLSKNPTEVTEYFDRKGIRLNDEERRLFQRKIETNDYEGLYQIAKAVIEGTPKYDKSIKHRAGLDYDYLALDNPEWAAEKYGKDLAQFDEAIANAKNEEDRTTLRDNKAILQQKYKESQGDYYKSLHAQEMVHNLINPRAANYITDKRTISGGFTAGQGPTANAVAKAKALKELENSGSYLLNNADQISTTLLLDNANDAYTQENLASEDPLTIEQRADAVSLVLGEQQDAAEQLQTEINSLIDLQKTKGLTDDEKITLREKNKKLIDVQAQMTRSGSGIKGIQNFTIDNLGENEATFDGYSLADKQYAKELLELTKNMNPQELMDFMATPAEEGPNLLQRNAANLVETLTNDPEEALKYMMSPIAAILSAEDTTAEDQSEDEAARRNIIQQEIFEKIKTGFNKNYSNENFNNDEVLTSNVLNVKLVGYKNGTNAFATDATNAGIPFIALLNDIDQQASQQADAFTQVEEVDGKYVEVENANPYLKAALNIDGIIGNSTKDGITNEDGMLVNFTMKPGSDLTTVKAFAASSTTASKKSDIDAHIATKLEEYNEMTGLFTDATTQKEFNTWYDNKANNGYTYLVKGYNVNFKPLIAKTRNNIIQTGNLNDVSKLATQGLIENAALGREYSILAATLQKAGRDVLNGTAKLTNGKYIYTPENNRNSVTNKYYEIIPSTDNTPIKINLVTTAKNGEIKDVSSVPFSGQQAANANALYENELINGADSDGMGLIPLPGGSVIRFKDLQQ